MPKKETRFQPLPENLKPVHRKGHRVHLYKHETSDQLLPDHPSAIDTPNVWIGRNGGPVYDRTMPTMSASMTSSKHDMRSRSESPKRARAARTKYWSFRLIHPESQQARLHLDMNPPVDAMGRRRAWARMTPVLPAEAPVVIPSKRQLYEQAQEWPRPPRRHFSERGRRGGWTESPLHYDNTACTGGADDFSVKNSGHTKKAGRGAYKFTGTGAAAVRDVCDSYGLINAGPLDLQHTHGMHSLDTEEAHILQEFYGDYDFETHDEIFGEDGEVQDSLAPKRDVDAMFELAQQKHALKMAAKRKRLQRQGWDVWDGDSIMSPEMEWESVHGEPAEDFELL